MSSSQNLRNANKAKNDEFYTELSEIEKELNYYSDKFEGKTVFCNCDDPFESNFVKYFIMHFNSLKLKALYATGYLISPIVNTELRVDKKLIPYSLYVTDTSKYLIGDQTDLDIYTAKYFIETEGKRVMTPLRGDEKYVAGDFRSNECLDILMKSDVVVTNPPFSLFREYIALLYKYNKQFIILGNMNSINAKEIFPLFKDNKVWLGCNNGSKEYETSEKYAKENPQKVYMKNNKYYTKLGNTCWYTNIDHIKRHTLIPMDLGHEYYGFENQYDKYDNYNAINIDRLSDIPYDYDGVMGVPISFMEKYCPEQFEIIGLERYTCPKEVLVGGRLAIGGVSKYARILIKRKDL